MLDIDKGKINNPAPSSTSDSEQVSDFAPKTGIEEAEPVQDKYESEEIKNKTKKNIKILMWGIFIIVVLVILGIIITNVLSIVYGNKDESAEINNTTTNNSYGNRGGTTYIRRRRRIRF